MPLAIFGTSGGLSVVVNMIFLFLVVVWLALVYWTYSDAKRRMDDQVLIMCATGASLFPFFGTIIYTILRPPEFLDDAHERELEIRATELRVRQLSEHACPHCEFPIEKSYLRCPNCRRRVKDPCANCSKPLDPRWGVCPYCETEVVRRQPAQRKAAPRRTAAQGQGRPAAQRQGQQPQPAQRQQGQARTQRQAAPAQERTRPQEDDSAPKPRKGTRSAPTS